MAELAAIVDYLERELRHDVIADYGGAHNGLQLANRGAIRRVLAAVDASLPVIEKAAALGEGSLLLVHHGMFWQGVQPLTGAFYRKIRAAMEADLAVFASHLPLDLHPLWGNNIQLAEAIGLRQVQPFFELKGQLIGVRGEWASGRKELLNALERVLEGRVHLCPGGVEQVRRVGLITGGAGAEVAAVSRLGIDTFITGEGPHWSYGLAEESGINLIYGGHYATETLGVKALAGALAREFAIDWEFIDHPSGL